jgi:hypothetical protein
VGEVDPSILCGSLGDASKLVGMEYAVCNTVELKPACKHLFD